MMKRHSIRRSITAALLTAGVALTTATGAQAVTPAHHGFWRHHHHVEGRVVSPQPVTVHYGPGVNRWATGTVNNGMHVWIVCKSRGAQVGTNDRWYKLAGGGGWIPAYYVNNYRYVRWCTR